MNYFAHGLNWLDEPFFLVGTAVPDWLSVVDRKVRVRSRAALLHVDCEDPVISGIAKGIVQHHRDDAWFHETRAFAELSLQFCHQLRQTLPIDDGFRPHFLGHILVELLLDAELISADPSLLSRYYVVLDGLQMELIVDAIAHIAGRPIPNLASFIGLFSAERFLWDYLDDGKLLKRLNQVMRRVGLSPLPVDLVNFLPQARVALSDRVGELLAYSRDDQSTLTTISGVHRCSSE